MLQDQPAYEKSEIYSAENSVHLVNLGMCTTVTGYNLLVSLNSQSVNFTPASEPLLCTPAAPAGASFIFKSPLKLRITIFALHFLTRRVSSDVSANSGRHRRASQRRDA